MKRLLLVMISAAAVFSCARSEIQVMQGKGELGLTIAERPFEALDATTRAAQSLYETAPESKAIENSSGVTVFQNGDAIGVYIHTGEALGASGNHSSNMRYSTLDKGATWRAGNAMGGDLIKGTAYRTTGYYPHQSPLVDPTKVAHSVATDQSATGSTTQTAAGAMEESDFMVAYPSSISGVPDSPSSTLTFMHSMSKLLVRVGVPTMIEGAKVVGVRSVMIKNTKVAASVDITKATALVGATVTPTGSVGDVTPRLMRGTGAAGAVSDYEAVLVPQTISGGTLLVDIVCGTESGGDKSLQYVVETGKPFDLVQGKKVTLSLSSSADLAFMSELDLLDGLAHTDLPLTIKVPKDKDWTLSSDQSWLTLCTTNGGSYSAKITGKGTGSDQTIFVKVVANESSIKAREAILSLATSTSSIIYGALQNYFRFDIDNPSVGLSSQGYAVPLCEVLTNQVWKITSGALPSWLKIVEKVDGRDVVWAGSSSITFPYEVIGSLNSTASGSTLYAVADVSALSTTREFTLKFGDKSVKVVQGYANPPAAGDYITVGNLNWTKGSLIADGSDGAKVGTSTDAGLTFQFGSLVGWNPTTTATVAIAVRPAGYTGGTAWTTVGYYKDGTSGTIPTTDSPATGIGDPCRYYLGGKWRTPTSAEYKTLFNDAANGSNWATAGGSWQASPAGGNISGLFFPAAGYRYASDGSLNAVGSNGTYWSASVTTASGGYNLSFNSSNVNPQGNYGRTDGMPVRCVEGISLIASSESVGAAAGSVTLSVEGTQGGAWTLAESGDSGNAFSPSKTSGTGDGTLTITIAANATGSSRSATYTLTSAGQTAAVTITQTQKVNPPSSSDYINIGNLNWTKGSLIAVGSDGAKVGTSTDAGLFFKFGSLVGWNPSTTATVAIAVKPAGYTGGTTWTTVGYYKDGTSGTIPTTDAPTTGIGDPCRYYLGGKWRTPTSAEYKTLFNNYGGGAWSGSGASWNGSGCNVQGLFFPAAGYRNNSDGSLYAVGSNGYYWSASVYGASGGYYLNFTSSNVFPQNNYNRTTGLPVRCVSAL